MAHTFLSLDVSLIPKSTKDNVRSFAASLFSNDKSRMIIDGYNSKGQLVHPIETFNSWLRWSDNPQDIINDLLSSSINYTYEALQIEKADPLSIWYEVEHN